MPNGYETQEDALHLRVFRNRPEPGPQKNHVHVTHELNFLCHGYQGLTVENRNYTMCPGDLLVLPAGLEHSIHSDESLPYQRIRLHMPSHFAAILAGDDPAMKRIDQKLFSGREWVIRFPAVTSARVQELMERMVEEEESRLEGWEAGLRACAELVALSTVRHLDCALSPEDIAAPRHRHDMNLIIHFLEEHYSEPITLTGMAEIFNINASVLSRNFKRVTGVAPMLFLNRIRVAQAKKRMEEGEYKLENVAREVGYNSLIYFSRVFKQLNGISPSQYRRMLRVRNPG